MLLISTKTREREEKNPRCIEREGRMLFFLIHTYVRMSTTHHSLFFLCLTSVLVCLRFFSLYCSTICCICREKKKNDRLVATRQSRITSIQIAVSLFLSLCSHATGLIKDARMESLLRLIKCLQPSSHFFLLSLQLRITGRQNR